MLPHVAGRPLMVTRCPDGYVGKCFQQKHMNASVPKHIRAITIREKSEERLYLIIDNAKGLVSLAQMGGLEVHTWCSREDQLEQPDQMIFDLDPAPDVEWPAVVEGATLIRSLLKQVNLECFAKVSGGKGLHIVVPIERRNSWEDLVRFAGGVADALATTQPQHYVATMSKVKRRGRIFVDYFRNQRGASCVAAFSPRSRKGAPVSAPVAWDALHELSGGSSYSIPNLADWLPAARKAWREFSGVKQRLPSKLIFSGG
jgi:bifunctional non-homologous end joining protein LigD